MEKCEKLQDFMWMMSLQSSIYPQPWAALRRAEQIKSDKSDFSGILIKSLNLVSVVVFLFTASFRFLLAVAASTVLTLASLHMGRWELLIV